MFSPEKFTATLAAVMVVTCATTSPVSSTPLPTNSEPIQFGTSSLLQISDTAPESITHGVEQLAVGETFTFVSQGRSHTVLKTTQGLEFINEPLERSVCATTLAAVLLGIGSAALLALAAGMAPGAIVVLGGYGFTASQVTAAAGAMASMSALEAFLDSKFCH